MSSGSWHYRKSEEVLDFYSEMVDRTMKACAASPTKRLQ